MFICIVAFLRQGVIIGETGKDDSYLVFIESYVFLEFLSFISIGYDFGFLSIKWLSTEF